MNAVYTALRYYRCLNDSPTTATHRASMFKFAPREYRWRNNHFKPANDFIIFTYHSPTVYEISEALSRIFIRFYPRRVSKRKWRGATLPEESLRNDARLELRAQL